METQKKERIGEYCVFVEEGGQNRELERTICEGFLITKYFSKYWLVGIPYKTVCTKFHAASVPPVSF
jgi:hypothetical protein